MVEFLHYPKVEGGINLQQKQVQVFKQILTDARSKGHRNIFVNYELALRTSLPIEQQFIEVFGDSFFPASDTSVKTRFTLKCFKISEYDFCFSKENKAVIGIFDIIGVRPCSQLVLEYMLQKCSTVSDDILPFKIITLSNENEETNRVDDINDIDITYEQARLLKKCNIFPELLYSDLHHPPKPKNIIFAHNILTRFYWKNVILSNGYQVYVDIEKDFILLSQHERDIMIKRLSGCFIGKEELAYKA